MENFIVLSSPREIYKKMIQDIEKAEKSVYLETYIYDNDKIGDKFRKALVKKAKQGVKVLLLIDALKSVQAKTQYFSELIENGGQVRFFKELRYAVRFFSNNHERNHRKLLLIDDEITYIGSVNITASCLDWRELVLRLEGEITLAFEKSFMKSWDSAKLTKQKIKNIAHKGFEIINDFPSEIHRITEKRYKMLIRHARKRVMIETPYFIPSEGVRKELYRAVRRGVKVDIVIPHETDYRVIDVVRDRYLGLLYKHGVSLHYYTGKFLHSKLLIVDNKFFLLGSSNLDYRSFIYQYDINLLGRDRRIIAELKKYYDSGLSQCKPFSYTEWKLRSSIRKMYTLIFSFIRRYL